ncbi:MAG: LysR family transcriptional regulator [Hyphomicrobium sp.]|jgi:DNA-binding transcriptional LysR family regulator
MEMHQVRYFLAVARLLNFTRAAEECHVAQPSLTRAIKQLEDELGGDLFRRERNLSHLTDLGQRMLPMMQQCYESAVSAKSLAQSIKSGAVAPISIALSLAIDLSLIVGILTELVRALPGLELRFLRGTGPELAELLKRGGAEIAIGGPLGETWDRLETWTLFTEPYKLVVGSQHALAGRKSASVADFAKARLLRRTFCEHSAELCTYLEEHGAPPASHHQIGSERDALALLSSNLGVCIMPESSAASQDVRLLDIDELPITRSVCVYAVSGRQRSVAAGTFIKMLRAADWGAKRTQTAA